MTSAEIRKEIEMNNLRVLHNLVVRLNQFVPDCLLKKGGFGANDTEKVNNQLVLCRYGNIFMVGAIAVILWMSITLYVLSEGLLQRIVLVAITSLLPAVSYLFWRLHGVVEQNRRRLISLQSDWRLLEMMTGVDMSEIGYINQLKLDTLLKRFVDDRTFMIACYDRHARMFDSAPNGELYRYFYGESARLRNEYHPCVDLLVALGKIDSANSAYELIGQAESRYNMMAFREALGSIQQRDAAVALSLLHGAAQELGYHLVPIEKKSPKQ